MNLFYFLCYGLRSGDLCFRRILVLSTIQGFLSLQKLPKYIFLINFNSTLSVSFQCPNALPHRNTSKPDGGKFLLNFLYSCIDCLHCKVASGRTHYGRFPYIEFLNSSAELWSPSCLYSQQVKKPQAPVGFHYQ